MDGWTKSGVGFQLSFKKWRKYNLIAKTPPLQKVFEKAVSKFPYQIFKILNLYCVVSYIKKKGVNWTIYRIQKTHRNSQKNLKNNILLFCECFIFVTWTTIKHLEAIIRSLKPFISFLVLLDFYHFIIWSFNLVSSRAAIMSNAHFKISHL